MERMKVAPVAKARALMDPLACLWVTNISLAISPNEAFELILAVFAIILKNTMSTGVTTSAMAADETTDAMSTLMNRFLCEERSALLICETKLSSLRWSK